VPARRRLTVEARRDELVAAGAQLFAAQPFDEVLMIHVADHAGVSRALLYRHFPSKRDLFAAIYRQAADQLLSDTELDPAVPFSEQIAAGLDVHIDYFVSNRHTVLAANRDLAGDPVIQAIISDELAALRERLLNASGLDDRLRDAASAVVLSWLLFVQTLTVAWLADKPFSRIVLRDICCRSLVGALEPLTIQTAPGDS
jgi:AcrR family transcriptional regulator